MIKRPFLDCASSCQCSHNPGPVCPSICPNYPFFHSPQITVQCGLELTRVGTDQFIGAMVTVSGRSVESRRSGRARPSPWFPRYPPESVITAWLVYQIIEFQVWLRIHQLYIGGQGNNGLQVLAVRDGPEKPRSVGCLRQ